MTKKLSIRIVQWHPGRRQPAIERLLSGSAETGAVDETVRAGLQDVRVRGDAAVAEMALRYDRCRLRPRDFRVPPDELQAALTRVSPGFVDAARETRARVEVFARAGLRRDWEVTDSLGTRMGERFQPLGRVGLYVPGGAAPLASTVLMTAPLARVAGVPSIAACTPAGSDGSVDPHILCALHLAGVDEVYRIGGIQAIGALAYGTRTIPRVDKIVGPGGPYVAAAKRLVYGTVALDLVAGPSEIAVLADDSASAEMIAADLLSQAEHGTGHERTLLVTDSRALAQRTAAELCRVAASIGRRDAVTRVLTQGTLLAVAPSMEAGVELINRFAPEHLELLVRSPRRWIPRIRSAGAIFVGPWTPESAGDFAIGPSHVLPTGGTARFLAGLTVEDFRRRTSVMQLTRRGLKHLLPVIETFSEVERLPAHGLSARARFERL